MRSRGMAQACLVAIASLRHRRCVGKPLENISPACVNLRHAVDEVFTPQVEVSGVARDLSESLILSIDVFLIAHLALVTFA